MTMSTSMVMSETRSGAKGARPRIREMGNVWRLDVPTDLYKLTSSETSQPGFYLPPMVGGALW